nr:MAG TPA: hypothetical protein [Caudoviricetes sp.]
MFTWFLIIFIREKPPKNSMIIHNNEKIIIKKEVIQCLQYLL